MAQEQDYRRLAQQFGGQPDAQDAPSPDYSALAQQYGGAREGEAPLSAFFNRGIARTATLGVGSDLIERGMRGVGVTLPDREPETIGEYMAEGAGNALGVVPAFAGGMTSLGARGVGATAQIARTLARPFLRAPASTVATEMAAGAGAGAGRKEGGPLGELAGGLAGGLGAGAYMGARRTIYDTAAQGLARMRSRTAEALFPFTEAGARPRAAAQLQGRVADPRMAAQALDGPPSIGNISPAQRVGDDNLLALERVIQERNPQAAKVYRDQLAASEKALREAAEEMGGGGLEGRIDAATRRAQERVAALTPERQAEEASEVFYSELVNSLQAARAQEASLWDIPNVRVPTDTVRERFAALSRDLPQAQSDDMPAVAKRLLGNRTMPLPDDVLLVGPQGETLLTRDAPNWTRLRGSESVRELHGFYSQMREEARAARAAGRRNAARIADELAEAAWADLVGGADTPTAVGAQLQAARAYSADLNRTFRQGDVGRLLGYAGTGERRVVGREALEVGLGQRGGAQAAVTAEELERATSFGGRDGAPAREAVADYLVRRMLLAARAEGEWSQAGARNFLRSNRTLLDRMPEIKAQLEQAAQGMETAARLATTTRTVNQAMRSDAPAVAIRRAWEALPAPERGALRTGLVEHGLYTSGVDAQGQPNVSGARLLGLVRNPETRGAYAEVFSAPELSRLEQIGQELDAVQRAASGGQPTIPGTERVEADGRAGTTKALTYLVGTMGARVGAFFGGRTSGASLRTASRMASMSESGLSAYMHRHADQLVTEAATDPDLYRALMTPLDAAPGPSQSAEQVLRQWMRRTQRALGEGAQDVLVPTMVGTTGAMIGSGGGAQGGPGPAGRMPQ